MLVAVVRRRGVIWVEGRVRRVIVVGLARFLLVVFLVLVSRVG